MTKEEAISRIQQALSVPNRLEGLVLIDEESADIAIEALQKDIEQHEMVIRASERHLGIVRCKDCKYFESNHEDIEYKPCNGIEWCTNWGGGTTAGGYCFEAERSEP